jgi:hypothetical protein
VAPTNERGRDAGDRPRAAPRATTASRRPERDPLGALAFRGAVIGLVAGSVVGLVRYGDELAAPVVVAMGAMFVGCLIGTLIGLALMAIAGRRRRRARGAARREREPIASRFADDLDGRGERASEVLTADGAAPAPARVPAPAGVRVARDPQEALVPAGWYPDPAGSPRRRWWDGRYWTDRLAD